MTKQIGHQMYRLTVRYTCKLNR